MLLVELRHDVVLGQVRSNQITKIFLNNNEVFRDVLRRQEKTSIGDVPSASDPAVIVLSTASYIRYRSVATRIAGRERRWMRHSIVRALGGFTTETSKTRILYCGESFDYPELEEHPYLCNHLGEFYDKCKMKMMFV